MLVITLLGTVVLFSTAVSAQQQLAFETPGPPDFCLEGPFHKNVPSPEDEDFHSCLSWQDNACCNTNLSRLIDSQKAVGLYNYSWELCGPLSEECERFIEDEECFYQCEPMLGYFQIANTGYIANVPVCADYCDRWFEACKDDQTCVTDWLGDFDYHPDTGRNSCPENSKCVTFAQMYGDGRGLCNRMWGNAFFYSEDRNNCTVMSFEDAQSNPNFVLSFPEDEATHTQSFSVVMTLMIGALTATFNALN